jgi:hypothetical protein
MTFPAGIVSALFVWIIALSVWLTLSKPTLSTQINNQNVFLYFLTLFYYASESVLNASEDTQLQMT